MGISEAIFARLSAVSAVTAIVGSNPVGVYPDQAPQKPGTRYVVFEVDDDDSPEHAMGEDHEDRRAAVRFYCCGATGNQARELAAALIAGLRRHTGTHSDITIDDCYIQGDRPIVEDGLKQVIRLVQFEIAYRSAST